MELRVLRYFLTVAQAASISAAAEVLHVTQPTLSRQLMELEAELGTKLFARGRKKRRMALTEAGSRLRWQAEEILALADKTLASFQGALDRIDSAKVYSDLDLDIYNLYETWHFERPEESLEELVDRTVSTMEMTLAE